MARDFHAMKQRASHASGVATTGVSGVRLDVWLWATRFFKTRALAKQAIEGGKIKIGDAPGKPATIVHAGDRLKITRGEDRFEIDVIALRHQRGSAALAQQCYAETETGRAARELAAEQRRHAAAGYVKPATKPDKRARRLIRALGDIDAF
jgi:ribosome-associated heat shock protein Hsp15